MKCIYQLYPLNVYMKIKQTDSVTKAIRNIMFVIYFFIYFQINWKCKIRTFKLANSCFYKKNCLILKLKYITNWAFLLHSKIESLRWLYYNDAKYYVRVIAFLIYNVDWKAVQSLYIVYIDKCRENVLFLFI